MAILVVAAAVTAVILIAGHDGSDSTSADAPEGLPAVEVISPRNGSRQQNRAVVVKVRTTNFQLAPREFGKAPQLGEGHLRFSLNRVPDCVRPEAIDKAINSPLSAGRLIGKSFDYPKYSGPNGVLAARIGTTGLYSPATKPEIYYEKLPPGFYRLVINLAQNNGAASTGHAVTNFEILTNPRSKRQPPMQDCAGKVSSADAAKAIR